MVRNLSVIFAHARCHCPLSALVCHLPRPGESFLVGEALAFRDVFQQTQIGFIENETSLPRAPLPGELASGCETERLDKGRLSSERNNAGAALYNLSVIFASLDATSPSRGGFGIPSRFPANTNRFHRKRNLFTKGSPARRAVEQMRDGEVLNPKTPSRSSQEGVGQALVYASMPWSAGG